MKYDLSIVIPARNEMFLARTIEDILQHSEMNTEVIAVLDGAWADPVIPQHERVSVIYHHVSIGQRAACNEAARLAQAPYIMKLDAHCSMAQGFDRILLSDMQPTWTCVPTMRNLWAFDWKCYHCGKRVYQDKPHDACSHCGKSDKMRRKMIWKAKDSPQSNSYCFDAEPHFQYFREYNTRREGQGDLTESMSLQGSCFMLSKEKWFELNICDEQFGSWGSQGIEVACKTWLSGGRVIINHKTYYAHLFRTKSKDFSFPYSMSKGQADRAKQKAREEFFERNWPGQIYSLSWLVNKFWPVPGWTKEILDAIDNQEKNYAVS